MQFSCQEKSWPKCPTDSDVQVNSWGAQELHCCKGEMCNDVIVTDASYKQKMLEVCSRFDEKEASANGRGLNCNEVSWVFEICLMKQNKFFLNEKTFVWLWLTQIFTRIQVYGYSNKNMKNYCHSLAIVYIFLIRRVYGYSFKSPFFIKIIYLTRLLTLIEFDNHVISQCPLGLFVIL